ncbi:gamma-glutamylputrescine oxidase [Pseudochelatococcus lubricantis]|uniref:Gamma-glutamylputrescine oxidase n=1 Tax=Pseudochelatococcus lubricantis TaxID=1538102 RepID=A0ABX0UUU4_9HYPH|nr:FAD-binding oxidoreductase [Pseudochelatococcus lubricantis]NIJ56733.1 gamma-glutamylputrescine oxidase [Pseudochelatococcus lubricantis]
MTSHIASYYAATANPFPLRNSLEGSIETDVCVIGAGYTGLSTALHLSERGYRVVVLEAAKVGWGASGRNGGQIVNGYSRDLENIAWRYGNAAAKALGAMSLEGGDIIRERIEKYGIACDYRPTNVFAAFNAKQLRELAHVRDHWAGFGHDGLELLDREGLRRQVKADCYVGGLIDHRGGHIHPLNLALGEAAAVESLGGRIFEQSPVIGVRTEGGKAVVATATGEVRATFAVACGNAYLNGVIPFLEDKVMPVSTQVVTTEVLGEATIRDLFPTLTAVEDANYVLDYYRPTADHRILFGGGIVYGGDEPADIEARLRPHFAKVFPALRNVRFDYLWSGNFALTLTRIPHLGRIGNNLYFAHGCSGHGVTSTHLAGRLIAEAIDGDATRFDAFANLPYVPFPGGRALRVPLTVLGAWWYGLRDRLGI